MNCLLLTPEEFDTTTGTARVVGRRRRHAEEILKSSPGDVLRIGLIGGQLGEADVLRLDAGSLELRVRLTRDPPPKRALTLVMAMPRPPVFRRLLSTIASLGIDRLFVVGTARTEKSFWQSHVLDAAEIRERFLLGLEQARDSILPEIGIHRYFEDLVRDVLPPLLEGRRGFLAHPDAAGECPHAVSEPIALFVGPEGGFVDYEVDKLRGIGFAPVRLGDRVMRVEPVIPLLVGRLSP